MTFISANNMPTVKTTYIVQKLYKDNFLLMMIDILVSVIQLLSAMFDNKLHLKYIYFEYQTFYYIFEISQQDAEQSHNKENYFFKIQLLIMGPL